MGWRRGRGEGEVGQRCPTALAMTDRSVEAPKRMKPELNHQGEGLSKKFFPPNRLGDWQGCADLFVQPLDEICGECGRFLFGILMNEEKEFLQTGLFPLLDSSDPILETCPV